MESLKKDHGREIEALKDRYESSLFEIRENHRLQVFLQGSGGTGREGSGGRDIECLR
jgi:hypothetical protein